MAPSQNPIRKVDEIKQRIKKNKRKIKEILQDCYHKENLFYLCRFEDDTDEWLHALSNGDLISEKIKDYIDEKQKKDALITARIETWPEATTVKVNDAVSSVENSDFLRTHQHLSDVIDDETEEPQHLFRVKAQPEKIIMVKESDLSSHQLAQILEKNSEETRPYPIIPNINESILDIQERNDLTNCRKALENLYG